MPAYEYNCKKCGKDFIVYLSVKEFESKSSAVVCPNCQSSEVVRKLSHFYTKTSKKS